MKTLITSALALALLASTAPAALAQDRPDRQDEEAGRVPEHKAPSHPATAQRAPPVAAPVQGAAPAPPAHLQPGPRGYYRPNGQGGDRALTDQRPPQGPASAPARSAVQASPQLPGQAPWREGRPVQRQPGPALQDDRYRQGHLDDRHDQGRRDDGRGPEGRAFNEGHGQARDWDRDRPRYDRHEYPFRFSDHERYRGWVYQPPRGFYVRHWGYGDIVPRSWWGPDYRISQWWSFGLPIPPIGYDWVRVGDDALLVDLYSGRVVQVAYDIFY